MRHGFQIGSLARHTFLSVDTIRFYEKKGLLRKPQRSVGGFRLYTVRDVERLQFVRCAQELGFSLAEVQELLVIHDNGQQACAHVRDLIGHKLDSVRQKIRDLKMLESSLKRALCRCEGALEHKDAHVSDCCPVLEELSRANNGKRS